MARDPLNVLPEVLLRAARLPAWDSIREACRVRVVSLREACVTPDAFAKSIGCSERNARRVLRAFGAQDYAARRNPLVRGVPRKLKPRASKPAAHPPASFCSCPSCLRARGAA